MTACEETYRIYRCASWKCLHLRFLFDHFQPCQNLDDSSFHFHKCALKFWMTFHTPKIAKKAESTHKY